MKELLDPRTIEELVFEYNIINFPYSFAAMECLTISEIKEKYGIEIKVS